MYCNFEHQVLTCIFCAIAIVLFMIRCIKPKQNYNPQQEPFVKIKSDSVNVYHERDQVIQMGNINKEINVHSVMKSLSDDKVNFEAG